MSTPCVRPESAKRMSSHLGSVPGIHGVFIMRCAWYHFTHGGSRRGGFLSAKCTAAKQAALRVLPTGIAVLERKTCELEEYSATPIFSFKQSGVICEKGSAIIGQGKPVAPKPNLLGKQSELCGSWCARVGYCMMVSIVAERSASRILSKRKPVSRERFLPW